MSSYRQYLFNKKYCVPARINTYNKIDESHICHGISQMGYQVGIKNKMKRDK